MKKLILSVAVLSAMCAAAASSAATVGATGTITFNGNINADTCELTSNSAGTSSTGGNIAVNMGSVSTNTLGTEASPVTSSGSLATPSSQDLNLTLQCQTGTSVDLKLTRQVASGKGIGLAPGGAQNVQIMLVDTSTGAPLDFTSGSVKLTKALTGGYSTFPLKAYYTVVSGKTNADVVVGAANGTVNYEISYN
ncbi:MAG: fimbrial protein [Achromobacter sp.]|uniref:fimbrial protein n=1 Tax=Achromobacter sp. TaxID=134375 RepID=UPI003CFCEF1F